MFSPAETAACCKLIELAFHEDFGFVSLGSPDYASHWGDVTTLLSIPPGYGNDVSAHFIAKQNGVISGLDAAALVFGMLKHEIVLKRFVDDGAFVDQGKRIATVTGRAQGILSGERIALNFVQHLSGIATLTRSYVEAVAGTKAKILDTRKTTPGWRLLEKYAVRCGGGHNHRFGLYDMVLYKDNHIAARRAYPRGHSLTEMVRLALKEPVGPRNQDLPVEIEVETLDQLEELLAGRYKPDIILLDNMSPEQMREAVKQRDQKAPEVLLEASGGVNLQTVRAIAETGVDRISVGALTHSAPALDISLEYESR